MGRVANCLHVLIPVSNGLVEGLGSGGGSDDPLPSAIHGDRPAHRAIAKFGEGGPLPFVGLADVLRQLHGRKPVGESAKQAAGVDLGELAVIADEDELA